MKQPWHDTVLIVIPSINGGQLLARMLPTLRVAPDSIVVIDQGSTDDTAAVCASNGVGVLQLNRPHTYTQACNIGAQLARDRGCRFLCVCNNDIAFRNDVVSAMYDALEQDSKLAIVAPAQIVYDPASDDTPMASRVFWNLETLQFLHDTEVRDSTIQRLEADFCELTCAMVRMAAIETIGFLDDEYGFYHEDADFGFRLGKAGYSCAYLPNAQIEHYLSSTIGNTKTILKANYLAKNKEYFAKKHLGYAVGKNLSPPVPEQERSQLNQGLQQYLGRYGLLGLDAPELVISHVANGSSDYLYTSIEAGQISPRWVEAHRTLSAIFATSSSTRDLLAVQGIKHCFHVPPGIDLDTFHPWGPRPRLSGDVLTVLAMVHGQQHRLLHLILQAWHRVIATCSTAKLVLYGPGLADCMGRRADRLMRVGSAEVMLYSAEQVEVHDVLRPRSARSLARLYRGVDCTITGIRGEEAALTALQSAACGVPCLAVDTRGTTEFSVRAAITPDYGVPDLPGAPVERLAAQLQTMLSCSPAERDQVIQNGLNAVRAGFTVRSTAMAFHNALSLIQIRRPSRVLNRLKPPPAPVLAKIDNELVSKDPIRVHLGTLAARRVGTIGRVIEQFGSTWQRNGLLHATSSLGREAVYFATHRAGQLTQLSKVATRRLTPEADRKILPLPAPRTVLLIGYIDGQLGLGQSLRGLALAMSRSSVPFAIYPFSIGVEGRRSVPYMPERYDETTPRAVNIIEVTVTELATVFGNIDRKHFDKSYNILRTYWELSKAPASWRPLLDRIDELWVPNAFVGESFRTIFDRTITIVPPCVSPEPPECSRIRSFDLDKNMFYFMFSFDYFSFPQRKNPLGVVRAFRRAFPDPALPVGLIVKSTGSTGHFAMLRNELRIIAQDDSRICLIDETLKQEDMLSLLEAADCYVSLHRSEGFGLGLAEAMALGKPVIATDYSGNTDFLREDTGYPVPFSLTPLKKSDYVHTENQVWAEPDEAACARAMARVYGNPAEVAERVQAGQRFIVDNYGPAAIARLVEARLTTIFEGG